MAPVFYVSENPACLPFPIGRKGLPDSTRTHIVLAVYVLNDDLERPYTPKFSGPLDKSQPGVPSRCGEAQGSLMSDLPTHAADVGHNVRSQDCGFPTA